jgi:hypothetical protein
LTDELGEHCAFADAGLPAQQHHFPRAAANYAARPPRQLSQRCVALQQATRQGWPPSPLGAFGAVSQKQGDYPMN